MTETSPAVEAEEPIDAPAEPRVGLLVTLALAWLAVILWSVAAIDGPAVTSVAIALPTAMAASLLSGGAVGLGAVTTLARRQPATAGRAVPRLVVAVPAGLVVGALAATSVLLTWGVQQSRPGLAVAIGLAALLGAVLAVLVPRTVAAAGLVAALGVFLTGFLINLFREQLMSLFGADGTAEARVNAFRWFAPTTAALSAIVGGLLAYRRLRGLAPEARWPAYLTAGLAPGAMLLLAEVFTQVGGARLLTLAGSSEADSIAFAWAADSRINHALVVLFLCPIVAMILFGRTLPARSDDDWAEEGPDTGRDTASAGRPAPAVPKPAAGEPAEPEPAMPETTQPS